MITQAQENERDAKRYRIMREILCASPARQEEVGALIAHIVGDSLTTQKIDRAMDHVLTTLKLV